MTPVSANVSFHNVTRIAASSVRTSGAPLTLTLSGGDAAAPNSQVTIFTNSQTTTDRLIAAINQAAGHIAPHGGEPATPEHSMLLRPNDYRD